MPANADKDNKASVAIGLGVAKLIGWETGAEDRLAGQRSGTRFEEACAEFLEATFLRLGHLRPGRWHVRQVRGLDRLEIAKYEQYAHLIHLMEAARNNIELAAALGNDYTITPDVIVTRDPEPDDEINRVGALVDARVARRTALRALNEGKPLLHASVSCKWTIRSDRAQNARSEALNLVRNRKGHLPHVVVVTAEPLPSRLASIALGTGDLDCVYHFALPELIGVVHELGHADADEALRIMVEGKRLKDISDLPLDLAV